MPRGRNTHDCRCSVANFLEWLEQNPRIFRGKTGHAKSQTPIFRTAHFEVTVGLPGRNEQNVSGFQHPPAILFHPRRTPSIECKRRISVRSWRDWHAARWFIIARNLARYSNRLAAIGGIVTKDRAERSHEERIPQRRQASMMIFRVPRSNHSQRDFKVRRLHSDPHPKA